MEEPKIKPQHKLFASYYVGECCGNAEQSAIKAGYSKTYARGNAHKLVARRDIQEYMRYLNHLRETEPSNAKLHIATISEIQDFWTKVMNNGANELRDRLRASELLAKAQGGFNNEW